MDSLSEGLFFVGAGKLNRFVETPFALPCCLCLVLSPCAIALLGAVCPSDLLQQSN